MIKFNLELQILVID